MTSLGDLARASAILGAMVGGVAAFTFGLSTALTPATGLAEPTPTQEATFDLEIPPTVIGGRLEFTGDRSGTMALESASGLGGRYEIESGGGVVVLPEEEVALRGPDGRLRFQPRTHEITRIEYDGLSLWVDPGQCTLTLGAVSDETGLMSALVQCAELDDIRDQGTVSVRGVVSLPADVLRGRGDMPPTGGTIEVGTRSITFGEAEIFLDGEPDEETNRIHWGIFTEDRTSGIHLQYDEQAVQYFLHLLTVGDEAAILADPCPLEAEELGRINGYTTTVRLTFECNDIPGPWEDPVSVTGSLVADVISGLVEGSSSGP